MSTGEAAFRRYQLLEQDFRAEVALHGRGWVSSLDGVLRPVYELEAWPLHGHVRFEYFARPFAEAPHYEHALPAYNALSKGWKTGLGEGSGAWEAGALPGWREAVSAVAPEWLARADALATQVRPAPGSTWDEPGQPSTWQQIKADVVRGRANRRSRKLYGGGS